MKIPPGVDPEVYKAFIEQRKSWPLGKRLMDSWRKFKPFGLTIIIQRPKADHYCLEHGHEHIGLIGGGRICRRCIADSRKDDRNG